MFKRMFLSAAITAAVLVIASVSGYAQGANVITNGDFTNATPLFGWTSVTSGAGSSTGQVSLGVNGPFAGNEAVLHTQANPANASISQTVSVTSGSYYRLAFGYQTNRTSGMTAQVTLDDGINPVTYNLTLINSGPVEVIKDYLTSSSNVTITFKVTTASVGSMNFYIDNVSLTEML